MKKIVFFNSTMQMGGPARVINLWSNYFVNHGYDIEIVSNIDVPLFYDFDKRVKYSILGIDKFQQTSFIKTLYKIYYFLKNRKNEVLIFNKGLYIPYLFLLKKLRLLNKSLNLVYFIHGGTSDFKIIYSGISNYMIYNTFKHIIVFYDDYDAYNKSLKRRVANNVFKTNIHKLRSKITYLLNPLTFYTNKTSTYTNKTVIAVGRLDYIKGFDLLIESWKDVARKHPEWKLKIIGSGDEELNLQNKIKELSLEKYIELIPQQKDVQSLYLSSSFYVMSSREEGLPMVVIEAMECGLPIVAFKNQGSLFLVKENKNGLLCDIADTKQLSINIETLINDKKLREKMGKKSKQLAQQFYIENMADKWNKILEIKLD